MKGQWDDYSATELAGMEVKDWWQAKCVTMSVSDQLFFSYCMDVPLLDKTWAYGCGIINLLLPGVGTVVGACMAKTPTVPKT